MAGLHYLRHHHAGAGSRHTLALDIQQRSTRYGHRRHHAEAETDNGSMILLIDPAKNGRITDRKGDIGAD
jgi:hypothetical protein